MNRRGFTMIELIVVLTVGGILAILGTMASVNTLRAIQLTDGSMKLANDISYAQKYASSFYIQTMVTFEASRARFYTLSGATLRSLPNPAKPTAQLICNLNTDFGIGINFNNSVIPSSARSILFLPNGTPCQYSTGTPKIPLASETSLCLVRYADRSKTVPFSSSVKFKTITIQPNTGMVKIL